MGVFEEQHQDDAILRPSRFDKFGTFDDLPPFQVKNRKPICTTMAPILQIQATPLKYSNMFAVRTVNAISFYPTKGIESPVHRDLSTSVHEYQGRELNRRSIADMALGGICGGEIGTGLVVDIEGALFGFGLGRTEPLAHFPRNVAGVKPTMYALRRGKRKDDYSGFAKVVWGGSRGMDAVVGLEDEVLVFDLRVSPSLSPCETLADIFDSVAEILPFSHHLLAACHARSASTAIPTESHHVPHESAILDSLPRFLFRNRNAHSDSHDLYDLRHCVARRANAREGCDAVGT